VPGDIKLPGVTNTHREAERRPSFDLAIFLIVLLAIAFRLFRIDIPFTEGHSWRQVTNADIARHFALGSMNIFLPSVSWGGLNGVVGMEFPLLHYVTAIAWRIGGESQYVARLISLAFSVTSVVLIFLLGRRWFGAPAGRAAAFLLAVSPSMVFFGRAFMSDTPMVTFMVAAVLAWDRYFERPQLSRAILAVLLTALAPLVKLPAIVVLAPIAGLGLSWLGWPAFRNRTLWLGCSVAVALVAGWYWYADRIYLETGLTQAVFRPSGTYPPDIAPNVFFLTTFHFATAERLLSSEFWLGMVDRFWGIHLTAVGFLGAFLGLFFCWRAGRALPVLLWVLGGFALIVVSAEGQWNHEFHQLPIMPALALLFGVGVAPLFDANYLNRFMPIGAAVAAISLILTVSAVQAFRGSNVIPSLYRPDYLTDYFVNHGNFLQSVVPPDALIVTVDYDRFGANSPMLVYFSRRQGWTFDGASITPQVIENLRTRFGAKFFASSMGPALLQSRHDLEFYLDGFERVPLPPGVDGRLILVDLRKVRTR
jgi:4-amino-4-deoxy-L-arabinose transferase-like glycosyltransferase